MYCNNCGKKLDDDAKFCPECGSKIQSAQSVSEEPEKGGTSKVLIIVAIVLGVLVLLVGGFFAYRAFFAEDKVEPAQETTIEEPEHEPVTDPITIEEPDPIDDPLEGYSGVVFIGSLGRDDYDTRFLVKRLIDVQKVNPEDILTVCCDDFDGNGDSEAFIFAGKLQGDEEVEEVTAEGTGWFVSEDYISELEESITELWGDAGRFIDCGARKYFIMDEYYATGYNSYVYSCKNGEVYAEDVSGCGYFYMNDDGELRSVSSVYDVTYDREMQLVIGHSWKEYYCYYNSDTDSIVEYGGTEIDVEDLDFVCGFKISDIVESAGGVIISAFERENGLVNINYCIPGEMSIEFLNATWNKNTQKFCEGWEDGSNDFEKSNQGGMYMESWTSAEKSYTDGEYAKPRRVTLYVTGSDQGAALDFSAFVYGREQNDDRDSLYDMKGFIIDDNTEMAPDDGISFGGRTDDMSAVEWMKYLIKADEEQMLYGEYITGVFEFEVTGAHVDKIIGQYWWD